MSDFRSFAQIIALCLILSCIFAAESQAATVLAGSASYADVKDAIARAKPEDTVLVPPGSATWTEQLILSKGVQLIGAGAGKSIITANYTGTWLISYTPSDYSANWPLRISGFTFDFNNTCGGIILNYSSTDFTIQTKIRIDNNIFMNGTTQAIRNNGMRGVAHNNIFTGTAYPLRHASGSSREWWDRWEGIVYGKPDNNFYYEDNIFDVYEVLIDCQFGNRYALRYNTISASSLGGSYPLCDMHGNQSQLLSCFGGEIYGNNITVQGDGGQILDQRGGKTVVFYNNVNGKNLGIKMREEYCDELNPTTNVQPQHVSDSYNWNNRVNYTGKAFGAYESQNSCSTYQIKANKDWWSYNPSYNGTTELGVGCGASMPSNCTIGDGFWLTNQSCSQLSDHVGPNPKSPITGTLFKCTSGNTWTPYYTPLPYPHPLRNDDGKLPPPTGLRMQN